MMSHAGMGKGIPGPEDSHCRGTRVCVFDKQQAGQCGWGRLSKKPSSRSSGRQDWGDSKELPVCVTMVAIGTR